MRRALALAVAAASVLVAACGRSEPDHGWAGLELCIATGGPSTVSYRFGNALARVLGAGIPGSTSTVRPRAAAVGNINLLASSACDLAIVPADAAAEAVRDVGQGAGREPGPSRSPVPVQALARLYHDTVHLVVRKDSGITTVAGLRGRRVATGARGSCTEFVAQRLLRAAAIQPQQVETAPLDIDDALVALRGDRTQAPAQTPAQPPAQAVFWSGEVPTGAIEQFSKQVGGVRLIGLGALLPTMTNQFGPSYLADTIPSRTYAGEVGVQTVAVPSYLMVNVAMDAKLARRITQLLFERREDLARETPQARNLDPRTAIVTQQVRLHRGAIEYYRSVKP